ncbi:MAG: S41 family peptidase [Sandaracinaceae bacterium]
MNVPGAPHDRSRHRIARDVAHHVAPWVAVVVSIATGCSARTATHVRIAYADLIVSPSACRADSPALLDPADVANDYDVLARLFRRGYAGYEQAGDEARWSEVLEAGRASLPVEPVTPRQWRDALLTEFAFLDDSHIGFWFYEGGRRRWRSVGHHRYAMIGEPRFVLRDGEMIERESGRALIDCGGRTPAEVLARVAEDVPDEVFAPVTIEDAPLDELRCSMRDEAGETYEQEIPLRRFDLRGARGPAFERLDAPFVWLRLRTLFTDRSGALETFVASADEVRTAPVVVLDLRRAGGGSDGYLVRWFRHLTADELRYWETDALESEVTLQGALTFWRCVRESSGATDAGGRAWLDARIRRAERELDEALEARGAFRDRTPAAILYPGLAPTPFAGRLLVVVDRGCGSACETAVLFARQIPGAVIVGENTEGAMKVGELRTYRLPQTGLWVSLGHRAHHDPFDGFREGYGYRPDLFVADEPERAIAEVAMCLVEPECGARLSFR